MKPMQAEWHVDSDEERSDVYRLLNMIHCMAARMARSDIKKDWVLHSTASYPDYAMTTWSNGIVEIRADTYKDYLGKPYHHIYTLTDCTEGG